MNGWNRIVKSVLVAPGALDELGGAPLRWRSLYAGLRDLGPVSYFDVPCPTRCGACPARDELIAAAATNPWASVNCQRQVEQLVGELNRIRPDQVVISEVRLHRFVDVIADRTDAKVVIDFHNVESDLRKQLREAAGPGSDIARRYDEEYCERAQRIEERVLRRADAAWTCSASDAALLVSLYGADLAPKIFVMPNSVGVPPEPAPYGGPPKAVFIGHLGYLPNELAAYFLIDQVAPLLRAALPAAVIVVSGFDCGPDLRLAAAEAPNVQLVEEPDDALAIMAGGIAVVPLTFGGGTRFKVLEAASVRTPVVSTEKGVEGLGMRPGVHYLRAESPAEFTDAIVRLVHDGNLRDRLTANGMTLLTEQFSQAVLSGRIRRFADSTQDPNACV